MTESEFKPIVLAAFNSLSDEQHPALELERSFDEMDTDSLAIQQVIAYIEEETGQTLPDNVLDKLSYTENIGAFYNVMRSHYVGA